MAPASGSTPVATRNRDTMLSRSSHVAHVS
jgi:hypothetical protein